MSTRNHRTPDEEEGAYVDSDLPVDAIIPNEDDRSDHDDRHGNGKGKLEHGAEDVAGKVKEGFGKITHNEKLEAEGEAQQAEAHLEQTRDAADESYRHE